VEGGGIDGGSPRFALMMPEKMSQPFLLNPAGSNTMSSTSFKWLDGYASPGASATQYTNGTKGVSHCCMWDDAPPTVNGSGQDVYDLKLFVTSNTNVGGSTPRTQFFVTPIRIIVSNPKTTSAAITSITKTGTTLAGPEYTFNAQAFEPMVVGDGRLLIVRVGSGSMPWNDPETGAPKTAQGYDIVYSYYPTGTTANPAMWANLTPISHAPFDTRINNKFGFARAPFRDAEGTLIPDGEDIGGSYPWMDRHAKNLVMETGFDRLHYLVGGSWNNSRYPQTGVPEETPIYDVEDGGKHQCITMMGMWTHGKLVQLDNLNNAMDYAVGAGDTTMGPQSRMVTLFQTNSGPLGNENGKIRLGFGRATKQMPSGENDNGNIIDSLENLFNYRTKFMPISLRDVAWPLTNGQQTDEVAFDDYLDPDAFIIANMAGLLTFVNNGTSSNYYTHHSGWSTSTNTFVNPVKLQNAATPLASRWVVPKHGLVIGNGRLEPAATGGVHGKGFSMNGSIGLEFTVLAQPQSVTAKNWYVGMFVDCRTLDDAVERRLITFPDGTSIRLSGRRQLFYANAAGVIVNRITLPVVNTVLPASAMDDLIPDTGWAHLAFQIRKAGTEVDFHLNGLIYNRWQDLYTALFQVPAGKLTLGKPAAVAVTGFTGWLDDFKMIAHSVDYETACNHAGGTLIGLPTAYTAEYKTKFADRFPSWTHDEITKVLKSNGETTYPKYANYYKYHQDNGVHRGNIPAGAVALRQSIHFPEGPLFYNAPRPNSLQNQFCITCHHTSAQPGLDLDALTWDNTFNANDDPRRQPMQPPKRLYGQIPAGLVDSTNQPATATALSAAGKLIDDWMLPGFVSPAAVQTFTVVDANTGRDLMDLPASGVIDPGKLGSTNLTIRANLNSAQGSVAMQYDTGTVNTRPVPPYAVFGTVTNPLQGAVLTPGTHTVKATPAGGALVSRTFTVLGNAMRVVADYRDDFKTHSPLPGWTYSWNATAAITDPSGYSYLAWSPVASRYMSNGLVFPDTTSFCSYGSFTSTGGHPGKGSAQGATVDRFVIAGYTVNANGYYGINSSFVTQSSALGNGGQVVIYTDTNEGSLFTNKFSGTYPPAGTLNFNGNVGFLEAGDTIYVGIGPNTTDGNDGFTLDFSIVFKENGNPLP
ncbi:MAG: hypothetical protein U0984_15740, partial [Prosthecobacter sp.]|nr:hypothetical protein [Prosthecobacter sp.]